MPVCFVFVAFLPGACSAAIIITAPTINLPYSTSAQTGSFEVYVQSTESIAPSIGADDVELQLPAAPGVTFTPPPMPTTNTTPTAHPYIFPNQSPTEAVMNSGRTVEGTDFAPSPPLPTLANGSGLLLVKYQVAPGAFGSFPLSFVNYPPPSGQIGTALFDGSNHPLAITLQNGSINIVATVPEPAAWLLALLAALGAASHQWRSFRGPHIAASS